MVKKIIIHSLLFISTLTCGTAYTSEITPTEYQVNERWLTLTTTFDIETKNEVIGTVHRKLFSLAPEYHLLDLQENLIAKGRMRFFNLFATFDITDQNETLLGVVKQEFSWIFPTFKIIAADGKKLGDAVLNFFGTTYTIKDPTDNHTIATISRSFFRLKSNWTIKIHDPEAISEKNIHPHLLMTLAAFQVDREYWMKFMRQLEKLNDDSYDFAYSTKEKNQVTELAKQLRTYKEIVLNITPSEEDFLAIEPFGEITSIAYNEEEYQEIIANKTAELLNLLSSDTLTDGQKAALYLLLEFKSK